MIRQHQHWYLSLDEFWRVESHRYDGDWEDVQHHTLEAAHGHVPVPEMIFDVCSSWHPKLRAFYLIDLHTLFAYSSLFSTTGIHGIPVGYWPAHCQVSLHGDGHGHVDGRAQTHGGHGVQEVHVDLGENLKKNDNYSFFYSVPFILSQI